ncbi:MAG: RNA polymerase sigma factor [Eubacteriales bacterium]
MTDESIVALYWARDEQALVETDRQYGSYCRSIAYHILYDSEDADECVNDTWMRAWNAMPPQRPNRLSAFLGRITRNLSLDRYRARHAQKRVSNEFPLILEELEGCAPAPLDTEHMAEDRELAASINDFLRELPVRECNLFLARYWNGLSIAEISRHYGLTQSHVKTILFRCRNRLRSHLEKEGITL